jgi:NhaA family Na+:H+ antiporter
MAIFFLYVGLEIKREMLVGELSNRKAAMLPMFAAVGGMVVPALLYVAVNRDGGELMGWGIPMATDIAFALGIMALLGSRVPVALKVFLTALAIVDDLGAVLVIALFYTAEVKGQALLFSLAALALAAGYNWLGGRRIPIYLLIGVFAWYFMLKSGVHATIAGVLLALAIPLERKIEPRQLVDEIRYRFGTGDDPKPFEEGEVAVEEVEEVVRQAHSPLHDLEHGLAPWVAFLIMPLFALFNAGFQLSPEASLGAPVALGSFLGLLLGKPVGVLLFAWLAIKLGVSALPDGVDWMALAGAGALAGVGFTMSLFIAALGLGDGALLDQAKLGVLSASVVAGVLGLVLLAVGTRGNRATGRATG